MPDTEAAKLCECGCGQPAPIAKRTNRKFGHIRGQPVRFIVGHFSRTATFRHVMKTVDVEKTRKDGEANGNWKGGRTIKDGYVEVRVNGEYILEHRFVMEGILGRALTSQEVVHHKNGNKQDNRPENLELLPSTGEHLRLHWQDEEFRANLSGKEKGEKIREEIRAGKRKPPPRMAGTVNLSAKLTGEDVERIRGLRGIKTQTELAREFGVSQSTISSIQLCQSWQD